MRYLITGSSGFVGKRLVSILRENGNEVIGIDLVGDAEIIADICTFDYGSLNLGVIDGIVHLAAKTSVPESISKPEMYTQTNVIATKRLFEWAVTKEIPRVVFASSAAVYGNSSAGLKTVGDEGELESPYAENKMKCEQMAEMLSSSRTNFICLRFFNIYGRGQSTDSSYSAVVPSFIKNQLNEKPLVVNGTGEQTRDFVNVDDVCKAIVGSLEVNLGQFRTINVGTGNGVSIKELCGIVTSIASENGVQPVKIINAPSREGDVDQSIANIRELDLILDINNMKSLREGIYEQFVSEMNDMINGASRGKKIE